MDIQVHRAFSSASCDPRPPYEGGNVFPPRDRGAEIHPSSRARQEAGCGDRSLTVAAR
jgi:hypothetical protein